MIKDTLELSDLELCKLVGKGDVIAYNNLYKRHSRRVYSLCLRMLQNTHEAEDLAQEVWVQFYRKASSFRGDSAFTTWLHRLTVNQVLMHFRKRVVKFEQITNEDNDLPFQIVIGTENHNRMSVVDKISLDKAIEQLPEGYKNVFILHDIEGYEHEEVAKILGCAVGTSKSQLHKARLKMKKLLSQKTNPRVRDTTEESGVKRRIIFIPVS